ncbi:hypothetical protein LYNGBM3L_50810 [Moorena producens 3L]|uniref:DinB-like domain-containing protein n=1 Tax=Moorena producens 3L TaxID=489825 RepID=F4XQI3_9CYAN|nr:DinB family protein [Moorena producens]EGJ33146.1 hypothetical protein LYNGBM3L_50810 [Moorena producens 3L]OLT54191.1 hypothetical protein BI334_32915 [Moorena producens 3L]
MEQIRWFDRKFEFSGDESTFPGLLERLEGTPIRVANKLRAVSESLLTSKVNEKWSIKEHVGHLIDLEPLWQGRLDDILNEEKYLRPTDLENKATDLAGHNDFDLQDLLDGFFSSRSKTMNSLRTLSSEDLIRSGLHPRLETPMRVIDLFLFVAEHDDHHLASIHTLINEQNE